MAVASDVRIHRKSRIFFPVMHLIMVVMVLVGFSPAFYLRSAELGPLSPFMMLHGVVMTAWMLLALMQSSLPGLGQLRLHRKMGWAGAALAVSVFVLGLAVALYGVREGRNPNPAIFATPQAFALVPFRDLITFAPLVGIAVLWRSGNPEGHKRLMLLATLTLMSAPLGRMVVPGVPAPLPFFVGLAAMILALVTHDLIKHKRLHAATLWGSLAIVVSVALTIPLSKTAAWTALVDAVT